MHPVEHRAYAVGHYALIFAFFVLLAVMAFQVVYSELHPAPLLAPCGAPPSKEATK